MKLQWNVEEEMGGGFFTRNGFETLLHILLH